MREQREGLRRSYELACRDEIEALKPGNVHVFADGHDMTVDQFLTSAKVSSEPLTNPDLPLGRRILEAVRETRAAVGLNTNLGIILLCAPLLTAAARRSDLRIGISAVLNETDMDDTSAIFAAIVHASPGGLGSADEHDVTKPPDVDLLAAMKAAADRDLIARQYITGFADVFDVGLSEFDAAVRHGESGMWPCVFTYLGFLGAFPDSHVARKFDRATAETVRREASEMVRKLGDNRDETVRTAMLMTFDQRLKAAGINPGTSADLTVAALLAHRLRDNLHIPIDNG